jgi:hypothetical protein
MGDFPTLRFLGTSLRKPLTTGPINMTQRAPTERRKRTRLALRWEVRILVPKFDLDLRGVTSNVSSEGFYCVLPKPLPPGEMVACDIAIPAPSAPGEQHSLHCRCTVVRTESIGEESFGVACAIDEYTVLPNQIR